MLNVKRVVLALLIGGITFGALAATRTVAAQQAEAVGQTSVAWTGDWQHDPRTQSENQVILTQSDAESGSFKSASYGEFQDESVDTASAALNIFTDAFMLRVGAELVVETGSGMLENGAVWRIYTFVPQGVLTQGFVKGVPLTFLVTVRETTDGTWVISTLTGNTDEFPATIEQAQQEITLNGQPIFLDGVDAQQVTSGLNATPIATPGAA